LPALARHPSHLMQTLLEIIRKSTEFLAGKGVESPRLQAELLAGHALGLPRMQLYVQFERLLTETELEAIRPLLRRRAQGEPLQYITGGTEFHGLRLKVDQRALIPRPETELLVERLIERTATPPGSILDLGTGSGAIALALARQYPEARVMAVDKSAAALELAVENARQVQLNGRIQFVNSDWFAAVPPDMRFDLIVANPPYLSAAETAATAPEVRNFEPVSALTSGGPDGAEDLQRIIAAAPDHLAPGGLLALETGISQHPGLLARAREAGFGAVESSSDLTGRDRFVFCRAG
jgi:release factor glutamine methyltransferase